MAGAGYKLFNTGDVLTAAQVNTYLMEQTVMVFADAAARTTALTGVVSEGMISYLKDTNAVEVYDGSNWVSSDDPNAIQNSIINAKGDLIVGSANDTPSILSVSSDGSTLVADSSQTTGLRYNPQNALSNVFINGGMDCWQRGTSFTPSAGVLTYTTDRFQTYRAVTGYTISRQTVSDSTNLPNIQYALRSQRDSGNTSTSSIYLSQSVETANAIPYAGKTVTLSFYARAGANFSAASSLMNVDLRAGTGTDENVNNGYTGGNSPITTTVTLTTTWQRFALTGTVGATVKEFAFYSYWTPVGTAGANDWVEITGLQLDFGTYTASSAPTFRRSGGTLAGELAACQRYYYRLTNTGGNTWYGNSGIAISTTRTFVGLPVPVSMRTSPSVAQSSLTMYDAGTNYSVSSIIVYTVAGAVISLDITSSAASAAYALRLLSLATNAYIELSAEL